MEKGVRRGAETKLAFGVETVLNPSLEVLPDPPNQPPELSIFVVQSPMSLC